MPHFWQVATLLAASLIVALWVAQLMRKQNDFTVLALAIVGALLLKLPAEFLRLPPLLLPLALLAESGGSIFP